MGIQDNNGSELKSVNETCQKSNQDGNKEAIEESIQESVEKCLQSSTKKISSINQNGDGDAASDSMETSEVTEFSDMKGLSVKVIGDDRSVSVDTKEICDDENIENNDDDNENDDDDSIDYVPVSEQIEPL